DGHRSQRDPSGAQARCDPRALPRQVALPFLTGPLWPPPEPHRRLLARDEGHHQRWTMVWHSPATLSAHAPGAHGASRAPHLCVPLVAHSASNFAGPAVSVAQKLAVGIFWERSIGIHSPLHQEKPCIVL